MCNKFMKIFSLFSPWHCGTMCCMNKDPSKPQSIRLPASYWIKLRELMQHQGRAWLEKSIDREHKKMGRGKE